MRSNHDELEIVVNWASRHLNKEDQPSRLGRQQLYTYDDGTVVCVKTSRRAITKDGNVYGHYWIGLSYGIVDSLLDAQSSFIIIKLADIAKYIVLPRDHIGTIHRNVRPKVGKLRYDIAIWPDKDYGAVIDGEHFDWAQYCYENTGAIPQIPEEIPRDSRLYVEGAVVQIEVNKYERDQAARAECIRHNGAVCKACECDMSLAYGGRLRGFIHVHHIVPLSSIRKEYSIDPKIDLIPLCPNCYAVVHYFVPPLEIEQLKELLRGGTIARGRDRR